MSSVHPLAKWSPAGWLFIPAAVTAATFLFPPAALLPIAFLIGLYVWTRPRGELRGTGVGMAIAALSLLGSNSAPSEVRVGAILLAVLVLATVSALEPRRRPWSGATIILLTYIGFSAMVSLITSSSSVETLTVALAAVVALVLVVRTLTSTDLLVMVRWIVGVATVQLLVAVAEILFLSEPIWGFRNVTTAGVPVLRYNPFLGDAILRTQGTFGHPIPFALFMIFTVFICLVPALRGHQALRYTGLSVAFLSLLLSGTRSAAVAMTVAALYYLISSRGLTAKARNVAIITIVAAVVFLADFGIRRVIFDLLASDSLAHRVDGWTLAIGLMGRQISAVVFGSGLNSEVATIQAGYLQQDGFAVIDNQWLTLLVTTGLVGVALFLVAMLAGWMHSGRATRALLTAVAVMFFSFDVTTWPACFSLLAVTLALPKDATDGIGEEYSPTTRNNGTKV